MVLLMLTNELYLTVLPIVHTSSGLTEETLTLFPSKDFATSFFPEEVDKYLDMFKVRAERYLTGGNVLKYDFFKEDTDDGRVVVRVIQSVR
jgi:hypothetical protein